MTGDSCHFWRPPSPHLASLTRTAYTHTHGRPPADPVSLPRTHTVANTLTYSHRAMDSQFMHPSFLMHAYDTSINGDVPTDTQAGKSINALLHNARLSARIAWEMQRNDGGIGWEGFARVRKDMARAFTGVEHALDEALAALPDAPDVTVPPAGIIDATAALDIQELRAHITADLEVSLLEPLTDFVADKLFPRVLEKLQARLIAPLSGSLEKPVVDALTVPVCDTLTRRLAGDPRYGPKPIPAPQLTRSASLLATTSGRASYDPAKDPLTCSSGFRMSDDYARDHARRTSAASSSSLSTNEITPAQAKPKYREDGEDAGAHAKYRADGEDTGANRAKRRKV